MTKKKIKKMTKTNLDFSPYQIIEKKRDGKKLSKEEIRWFIDGLATGAVADYQMSALLMAIFIRGMDKAETAHLTDAMLYSGATLKFKGQGVVDKHSTGGVGDKASFILAPLAAACGVKVPMMAGRGLGHTGGTVDKIEAIKGFKTTLSLTQFKDKVQKHGLALIGQTGEIAPADKKIYALRDVTATINSIPLITASIMSKKLAEGANGIVMDIKVGNGAFMKDLKEAKALAKSLRDTASRFNKKMITMITDMDQPLGNMIGNSLELIESFETLKGNGPKDLTDLSVDLAAGMVLIAKKAKTMPEARKKVLQVLHNGKALTELEKMIKRQGGDHTCVENYKRLPMAKEKTLIKATKKGIVHGFNCKNFGLHCVALGGGRMQASDKIDFGVGLELHKKVGEQVNKGDVLVTIYHNKNQKNIVTQIKNKILKEDLIIKSTKLKTKQKLIYEVKKN